MAAAVAEHLAQTDVLIGTAAVSDWRPANRAHHKLAKRDGPPHIEWARNPDIMALAGAEKGDRLHIGFALEDPFDPEKGRAKMQVKRLDYVVVNGIENLAGPTGSYQILSGRTGRLWRLDALTKERLAELLVDLALNGEKAMPT
jgi:phosphopantothenoylcysteine decarboxylase/phosphopantothenate--cysteine ligase